MVHPTVGIGGPCSMALESPTRHKNRKMIGDFFLFRRGEATDSPTRGRHINGYAMGCPWHVVMWDDMGNRMRGMGGAGPTSHVSDGGSLLQKHVSGGPA